MKKLKIAMVAVGILQIVLGVNYLLMPHTMLAWMGHSSIAPDIAYPLGMLAARFLVYGGLLLAASRNPAANRMLILGMVWIQLIDFSVGAYFTAAGVVGLKLSAFPLFNAALIAVLLWIWRPLRGPSLNKP